MAARSASRSCTHSSHTAPAARIFLQLGPRPRRRPHPILDFLAPRVSQAWPRRGPRPAASAGSRGFGTTGALRETVAIHNPRRDEDGRDMRVEITPRASNRLREIMAKDGNPNLALRITVESGGCHGFQYLMSLTSLPPSAPASIPQESRNPVSNTSPLGPNAMPSGSPTSSILLSSDITNTDPGVGEDEDDTIFKALDGSEAKVVMDGPSLELLKGSKIDYTMELIGSQFKIVDNPLATSSCGCGTSFDIKAE